MNVVDFPAVSSYLLFGFTQSCSLTTESRPGEGGASPVFPSFAGSLPRDLRPKPAGKAALPAGFLPLPVGFVALPAGKAPLPAGFGSLPAGKVSLRAGFALSPPRRTREPRGKRLKPLQADALRDVSKDIILDD